jgi:hypothetical protein
MVVKEKFMMGRVVPLSHNKDPSAYRPQPARDGPDFWPTIDSGLILALVHHVLPALSASVIWEAAAGDGRLVDPLRKAGRTVVATDRYPNRSDIAELDFLHSLPPPATREAIMLTNPPNSLLTEFIVRGLTLIDTGHLNGLVLLCRTGHDTTKGRAAAFNRGAAEWRCCWRPYWKPRQPGDKQPRWTYQWNLWRCDYAGPPVTYRLTQPDVVSPPFDRVTMQPAQSRRRAAGT